MTFVQRLRHAVLLARPGRALLCLLVLGLLSVALVPDAAARISCSYVGAPTNSLTVTANDSAFGHLRRSGSEIAVWEYADPPVQCAGGVPTVSNTDLIMLRARDNNSFVDVRLAGGPFAPGATAEPEGASEIEIEFRGNVTWATIIGTRDADAFHWGPGRAQAGLNLNPATAGDEDVDVTVTDTSKSAFLVVEGRAGDDTIIPAASARISHFVWAEGQHGDDVLVAPHAGSDLEGGAGADVIRGGSAADQIGGGFGDDVISGGGGVDDIWARSGRDVVFGGRGGDLIISSDGERDQVSCGAGRDRVGVDRRDRLRSCEVMLP
jgi:Ca2+-binding RTX toxin-like protein